MISKEENKSRLMTETTFYILLTLVEPLHGYAVMKKVEKISVEPLHGYAVMKKVEKISEGTVIIGPGTLYGAFSKMVQEQLIEVIKEDDRRKFYQLTGKGKKILSDQIIKLSIMVKNGRKVFMEIQ
jgi:DNA-binding PadR family transcriptional regulator